jgi:hypothetical protein
MSPLQLVVVVDNNDLAVLVAVYLVQTCITASPPVPDLSFGTAAAMAAEQKTEWNGGEVLYAGGTDWAMVR